MDKFTLTCPAKINLYLEVGTKESATGYHRLNTVLARVNSLCDFIHMEPSQQLSLECTGPYAQQTPTDENNTVLKAIRLLEKETGKSFSYKIDLEKNIPPQSGLGGGSSNAAAVLVFLNEHEGLGLSHEKLMQLGAQVGMDVPFFVSGAQVAQGTHYGEKITPLKELPQPLKTKIHFNAHAQSTKEAYEKWDNYISNNPRSNEQWAAKKTNLQKMLTAIEQQNAEAIIENLHNDFESISPVSKPAFGTILAGSGSAYVEFCIQNKKPEETQ